MVVGLSWDGHLHVGGKVMGGKELSGVAILGHSLDGMRDKQCHRITELSARSMQCAALFPSPRRFWPDRHSANLDQRTKKSLQLPRARISYRAIHDEARKATRDSSHGRAILRKSWNVCRQYSSSKSVLLNSMMTDSTKSSPNPYVVMSAFKRQRSMTCIDGCHPSGPAPNGATVRTVHHQHRPLRDDPYWTMGSSRGRHVADDVCKRIFDLTQGHLVKLGNDASRCSIVIHRANSMAEGLLN